MLRSSTILDLMAKTDRLSIHATHAKSPYEVRVRGPASITRPACVLSDSSMGGRAMLLQCRFASLTRQNCLQLTMKSAPIIGKPSLSWGGIVSYEWGIGLLSMRVSSLTRFVYPGIMSTVKGSIPTTQKLSRVRAQGDPFSPPTPLIERLVRGSEDHHVAFFRHQRCHPSLTI